MYNPSVVNFWEVEVKFSYDVELHFKKNIAYRLSLGKITDRNSVPTNFNEEISNVVEKDGNGECGNFRIIEKKIEI